MTIKDLKSDLYSIFDLWPGFGVKSRGILEFGTIHHGFVTEWDPTSADAKKFRWFTDLALLVHGISPFPSIPAAPPRSETILSPVNAEDSRLVLRDHHLFDIYHTIVSSKLEQIFSRPIEWRTYTVVTAVTCALLGYYPTTKLLHLAVKVKVNSCICIDSEPQHKIWVMKMFGGAYNPKISAFICFCINIARTGYYY